MAGYRIVRELGRGGMGVVYEAVHVDLDRPVALKVLGTHAAPDSNGRRRFLNEAKTAAGLHHTHIVPVFDVGQVGGLCYYAMQRIEGCGLDRVVKSLRLDRSVGAGSGSFRSGRSGLSPGAFRPATDEDLGLSISGLGGSRAIDRPGMAELSPGRSGGRSRFRPRPDEPMPFEPPRGSAYYRWVAQVGRMAAEALGTRTVGGSFIATSSRRICWSMPAALSGWPTSASPVAWPTRASPTPTASSARPAT